MKKYLLLLTVLLCGLSLPLSWGAEELSTFNISDARMPIYNNGKLSILAYSRRATRSGLDILLKEAILDIIKPGIDVDRIKYVDGMKPYPLDTPLKDILKFWMKIIHSNGMIFSDAASINQQTKNAQSREKIFFRSPMMDVNGVGFQADFAKRTVKILKDVIIKIRQVGDGKSSVNLLPGAKQKSQTSTSTITAEQMFIDFTNNFIIISGNVRVNEAHMTIDCDKITVYLQQGKSDKVQPKMVAGKLTNLTNPGSNNKISRIICENNVVITRKQSLADIKQNGLQQAFADKADYDLGQSKIVLTGKRPMIKRGTEHIEGKQITLWRDQEHLLAQGDCRLSFMPRDNKRIKKTDTAQKPTIATADSMEMNSSANLAVLSGNVQVVDSRMKIDCHKMNIYLEDRQKVLKKSKKKNDKNTVQTLGNAKAINKIICIGDVTIVRLAGDVKAETQKAMAGKAIYHLKEGKIILSENNPIIIRGRDSVNGKIITVWVDQQKMHVDKDSLIVLNSMKNSEGKPVTTRVNSDFTNIDYGKNLMSFAGRVKVKNPQMTLDCKKMLIFLEDQKNSTKKVKVKTVKSADPLNMKSSNKEVSKIICLGDVFARDARNKVNCQKLTLFMQDKPPATGVKTTVKGEKQNSGLGGNREVSRIICQDKVVMVRMPATDAAKKPPQTSSPVGVAGNLVAGNSDKPIIVKTDFMDLKLAKNYGELIGHVDVDEPRANLKCDKMELYAKNTPTANTTQPFSKPKSADDEFDNEVETPANISDEGSIPKKISLGDNKELEKIVCLKHVVIVRKITANDPVKEQATSDKAVYFVKDGKIELTENPALHQGDNVVLGRKITLWTDSERLDIERGNVKELELPNK